VWDDDRYNERVDHRSWWEMATFLGEAFGEISYGTTQPDQTEVVTVEYDDDGFALTGYLAIPPDAAANVRLPAVVIVPDWDGVSGPDGYESQRATLLAEEGYIAMAADIYGSDKQQVDDFEERANLTTIYRADYGLFVSRIQAAVDVVMDHELVDKENIFLIGCKKSCFVWIPSHRQSTRSLRVTYCPCEIISLALIDTFSSDRQTALVGQGL
jgi:DNA-binding cell septation regulator SpoVG